MFGLKNKVIFICLFIIVGYFIAKMFSRGCDCFSVGGQSDGAVIISEYGGMIPSEFDCGLIDKYNVTCDGNYKYKCAKDLSFRRVTDQNNLQTYGCYFDPDKYEDGQSTGNEQTKYYYSDYNIDDTSFPGIPMIVPKYENTDKKKVYCSNTDGLNLGPLPESKFKHFNDCLKIERPLIQKYGGRYCKNTDQLKPSNINCSNQKEADKLLTNFNINIYKYTDYHGEEIYYPLNYNSASQDNLEEIYRLMETNPTKCSLPSGINKSEFDEFLKTQNGIDYSLKPYFTCYNNQNKSSDIFDGRFDVYSNDECDLCSCRELCIEGEKCDNGSICYDGCCDGKTPAKLPQSTCSYDLKTDKNGYTKWFDIDPDTGIGPCNCPKESDIEYDMADGPNQMATKYRCKLWIDKCLDKEFYPLFETCCTGENVFGDEKKRKICGKNDVCCGASEMGIDIELTCCPEKSTSENGDISCTGTQCCGIFSGCSGDIKPDNHVPMIN